MPTSTRRSRGGARRRAPARRRGARAAAHADVRCVGAAGPPFGHDRPGLVRMPAGAHSVLAAASRVDGEIMDDNARRMLDGLAGDGSVAARRANTGEEAPEFWSVHRGTGEGPGHGPRGALYCSPRASFGRAGRQGPSSRGRRAGRASAGGGAGRRTRGRCPRRPRPPARPRRAPGRPALRAPHP